MKLSIVTTLYYSAPYLEEFYTRIQAEATKITDDYEIVLVNDGSPDGVLELALGLRQRDARVVVVDLSRNFGHHKAIMTGLAFAQGDLVYLTDCDLEEEPELLGLFYAVMGRTKAEMVFGVQKARKGDWWERESGALFWRLFNLLSSHPAPPNQLTSRLMVRNFVTNFLQHAEQTIFLGGLWALTGFKQIPVEVTKRAKGSSTYTVGKKVTQLVDAVTAFSARPLTLILWVGALITLGSTGVAGVLAVRGLFGLTQPIWGWLLVSLWLMGGLVLSSVGLVGVYLARVFSEVKQRPRTIVRAVYEGEAAHDGLAAANFPVKASLGIHSRLLF
ncbi:MAG: glycosyltransferase family 2 protein [Caldilineaceae bacterium]